MVVWEWEHLEQLSHSQIFQYPKPEEVKKIKQF